MVLSADVTRYAISLGARDTTTGWRAITLTQTPAGDYIEMLIMDRGATGFYTPAGYHGQIDALGQCVDPVAEYDHILTDDGRRYEVKYVQEVWQLDNFIRRDCALSRISGFYQAVPSSTATWQTAPADPRSRVKTLIDLYANVAHTWIVLDDGVTAASFACIFAEPPYPVELEYRGTSNMHGLYVVEQPDSTPLIDGASRAPYGYDEQVPVHCLTVDSTNCHGDRLRWAMERELRYIFETYPSGSVRQIRRRGERSVQMGSTKLYDVVNVIDWKRDVST